MGRISHVMALMGRRVEVVRVEEEVQEAIMEVAEIVGMEAEEKEPGVAAIWNFARRD